VSYLDNQTSPSFQAFQTINTTQKLTLLLASESKKKMTRPLPLTMAALQGGNAWA